jgi:hypothetical protein
VVDRIALGADWRGVLWLGTAKNQIEWPMKKWSYGPDYNRITFQASADYSGVTVSDTKPISRFKRSNFLRVGWRCIQDRALNRK